MKELFSRKTEKDFLTNSVLMPEKNLGNFANAYNIFIVSILKKIFFFSYSGLEFFETSAKENVNVKAVFER